MFQVLRSSHPRHNFSVSHRANILNNGQFLNDHVNMIQLLLKSNVIVYDMSFQERASDAVKVKDGSTSLSMIKSIKSG